MVLTAAILDNALEFLSGIQGIQVECLDGRSCLVQFRRVIRRRRELLQNLTTYACRRLLHTHNRAVAEIRLNKEDHLFVAHQNLVAADIVQPALYGCFDSYLIFVSAGAGRREGRRNCWNEGLRIRGYQVVGELDEFGMRASDIAELCRAELG